MKAPPSTHNRRLSPLYTPPHLIAVKAAEAKRLGKDEDGAHRIRNRIDANKQKAN